MDEHRKTPLNSSAKSQSADKRQTLLSGLVAAVQNNKLGHALLLSGIDERHPDFIEFLYRFCSRLLCLNPTFSKGSESSDACGICESCRLLKKSFEESTHPDALWLKPESQKGYTVDQIRSLLESFHLKRSLSPVRLCWITQAEDLSGGGASAANALLKLLEEPRPDSYLILTSSRVEALLPTIRSRCQHFKVPLDVNLENLPDEWQPLMAWLLDGCCGPLTDALPPDHEDFWAERESAIEELEKVHRVLWEHLRLGFDQLSRDQGLAMVDFMGFFEALIKAVKAFAAAPLQWSHLKLKMVELAQGPLRTADDYTR